MPSTTYGRPRAIGGARRRALRALVALATAAGAVSGAAACTDKAAVTPPGGGGGASSSKLVSAANPGGTAVQAAVVVFNASTDAGTKQSVTVTASGIAAPLASRAIATAPAAAVALGPDATLLGASGLAASRAPIMSDAALMRRLRDHSRRTGNVPNAAGLRALYQRAQASGDFSAWRRPAPLRAAGRAAGATGLLHSAGVVASAATPSGAGANVNVGDTLLLNVRVPDGAKDDNVGAGDGECSTPNLVKARIAAVSNKAIVAVDTRNPAGGLGDAFYASVATTFDTLVYPTDTRTFGAPVDIDHNGRAILFYTRAVNGLTPANSASYIGGFFYSRDLRPTSGGNSLTPTCAGSNAGELFYLLAPDPTGAVNGNRRDTAFVRQVTVGTAAHEFQHLINAERRLFVLNTQNFDEDVWLNEGLSHIAEEITFYQSGGLSPAGQAGQSPRARLTARAIQNAGAITALNQFGFQNLARFSLYLNAPSTNSPYADNDSLETRGATWSFLRYAADRSGVGDATFFSALVNSSNLGINNLRAVIAAQGGASAGVPLETWFLDWAVSHYADGLASNLSPEFTQPSWVFRNVLTQFQRSNGAYINGGVYPLATADLAAGTAQTISLGGGSAGYYVFSIPAGSTAAVSVNGTGSSVRAMLVQATGAVSEAQ